MNKTEFKPGGYRYLPFEFQYSSGVQALPGFGIVRYQFHRPVPLTEGFKRIEKTITALGRPMTAFCACELRSPGQFTPEGFTAFNREYVTTLERWGVFKNDENPVARSNVCPEQHGPDTPSFHAFSFTVEAPGQTGKPPFVIAGGAEMGPGEGGYADRIVRYGETGPDAMREKAITTLGHMEQRLAAFDLGWSDCTAVQAYSVHSFFPVMSEVIVRRGAAKPGLTWHYCQPPVQGLEYEMDCRGVPEERILPG